MSEVSLTFRPLERVDFAVLSAWLAEPLVARWWNHEHDLEAIERAFGASVDRREPTDVFLATTGDRPFGLIQRYRIGDYPEYLEELGHVCPVPARALSIDYLIGEPDFRGRALGSRMICSFVELTWSSDPSAGDVIVPVSAANRASWRSLERAGFTRIATGELKPDNPTDSREHVIYRRSRAAI